MFMLRSVMPLGAVSLLLAVAGCGGNSSNPSSSTSAGAGAASTASASGGTASTPAGTSSSPAGAATTSGGITQPGTTLKLGDTATVPFKSPASTSNGPPPYKLQVTVQSITKASMSDFKGIQLDATEKAGTPYYVRFKVTNVGDGDIGTNAEGAISGVDNTGQQAQSVTFIGTFPPCNDADQPKPFTRGKTWSTCQVYLVPGGITAADYSGFVDSYLSSPVKWK
jgi:hypothetical protein